MKMDKNKLKIAFYWAASCGGCEIAVLDINEKILDVVQIVDIVFWPVAMDVKYKDVENMPDKYIDITLFNGSIRNSEQEHMAKLLRQKSKTLVAFGSCAHEGKVDQGILNMVEMAFRAYDPCFACATHVAVGQMLLTVQVYDSRKQLVQTLQR